MPLYFIKMGMWFGYTGIMSWLVDTYQILTHTSSSWGQMAVMSHSTLQLPLPAQLVARMSQNLHSLLTFIIVASGEREKKWDRKDSSVYSLKT